MFPKKHTTAVLCALLFLVLTGCSNFSGHSDSVTNGTEHFHQYSEANCNVPRTCSCGLTEGEALGHDMSEANCTSPATCSRCGQTDGDPIGHLFVDATCINAKVCNRCGTESGRPLGHDFSDATYDAPKTCKRCGKTNGTKLKLSESCDMVLADGQDLNGDRYELVANETEDYNGTSVEIGVIKNNEWMLKPTSNMPFVDMDGTPYGKSVQSIYKMGYAKILYIGNGCFLFESDRENMIYNVESKESFEKIYDIDDRHICISYDCITWFTTSREHVFSDIHYVSSNNPLLIIDHYSSGSLDGLDRVELLDTNTMEVFYTEINYVQLEQVYPVSEGAFAVGIWLDKIRFYSLDGSMLFDNNFTLRYSEQKIWFNNGLCSFEILNDAGTPYRITIDMDGNVVESVKLH